MSEYIFAKQRKRDELRRLQMIEEALDPLTIARLQQTGIRAGWNCLELGAGAGSIMNWMANVVGDRGTVVGVDKDTSHLLDLATPPCRILKGDFLEVPLDYVLDVAHCRYVLIHNRASDDILRRVSESLKPGGWLVVEEPDFTSAKLLNPNGSQLRVSSAICRMFEQMGLDPGYGLSLPERIVAQGLSIAVVDSRIHLAHGDTSIARLMGASTRALADKYVATGEANAADIDAYIRNSKDETLWSVYYATVSVIATK